LNAPSIFDPIANFYAPQGSSRTMRIGIFGTHTSPPCALARFNAGLTDALSADGSDVTWMAGRMLSQVDVVIIQHDVLWAGDEAVDIVDGLRVPSIVVLHTIPKDPSPQHRAVLESVTASADHVVVMSEAARTRLYLTYRVDRRKITMIPHGANVPTAPRVKRPSRPTILTWGLLRPGKGIERVIDAMPSLADVPGRPRYVVAGPMDPRIPVVEAEAYRDSLLERARRLGVADSVSFDPRYYDNSSLAELIQQASVVVVPDDSTEQVSSGVLADALANGRPVVATAFPHAVELLGSGAGMVVRHDDSAALATALRQIITQPRLAGSLAAEVRQRAPGVGWPVVAAAYRELAERVVIQAQAAVWPRADSRPRDAGTTGSRD